MSTETLSNRKHKTFVLSIAKGTWVPYEKALFGALRAVPKLGRTIMTSLREDPVREDAWFALPEKKKDHHFECDAKIAELVSAFLDDTQESYLYQFNGNEVNPETYEEEYKTDDGEDAYRTVYPEGFDHSLTKLWPSRGRAAYDFLRAKFAGKPGDKKVIAKLAELLSKTTLANHRGDAQRFAQEYRLREASYINAVKNTPGFSHSQHAANQVRFLTQAFKAADKAFYQWQIDEAEANRDDKSPEEILQGFVLKWETDGAKVQAIAPQILATSKTQAPAVHSENDFLQALTTAVSAGFAAATGSGRARDSGRPKRDPSTRRPPLDAASKLLFQVCYDAKTCFRFQPTSPQKGVCPNGDRCKYKHQIMPVPSAVANVAVDERQGKHVSWDPMVLVTTRSANGSPPDARNPQRRVQGLRSPAVDGDGFTLVLRGRRGRQQSFRYDPQVYSGRAPAARIAAPSIGGARQTGARTPSQLEGKHDDDDDAPTTPPVTRESAPAASTSSSTSKESAPAASTSSSTRSSTSKNLLSPAAGLPAGNVTISAQRTRARKMDREQQRSHIEPRDASPPPLVPCSDSDTDDEFGSDASAHSIVVLRLTPPRTPIPRRRSSTPSSPVALVTTATGRCPHSPALRRRKHRLRARQRHARRFARCLRELSVAPHRKQMVNTLMVVRARRGLLPSAFKGTHSLFNVDSRHPMPKLSQRPSLYKKWCARQRRLAEEKAWLEERMRWIFSSLDPDACRPDWAQGCPRTALDALPAITSPTQLPFLGLDLCGPFPRVWRDDFDCCTPQLLAEPPRPSLVVLSTDGGSAASLNWRDAPEPPAADGTNSFDFVVDTGANTVLLAGDTFTSLSNFQPSTSRVHSNAHADTVSGTASLHVAFEGSPFPARLDGLVAPDSRFNILPPLLVPGFAGAVITASGRIDISLANGHTIRTFSRGGLEFLRVTALNNDPQHYAPTRTGEDERSRARAIEALRAATAGLQQGNLVSRVTVTPPPPPLDLSPTASPELVMLHNRLAHAGISTCHRVVRSGAVRVKDPATRTRLLAARTIDCHHCAIASMPSKRPLPTGQGHLPSPSDDGLWSTDLFGPFPASGGGAIWATVWLSHRTGKVQLGFHKSKADVFTWFVENHDRLIREDGGRPINIMRSDNGELVSSQFKNFLETVGIIPQNTSPASSFQNGRAERIIRTLRTKAGASLSQSGLPVAFWAESFMHAAYVHNRISPRAGGPSPEEKASGQTPTLRLIHPFGCLLLARVNQPKKGSQSRARSACLLSPASNTKDGFKILHLDTRRVAATRNCVFFDDQFPFNPSGSASCPLMPPDLAPTPPPSHEASRLPRFADPGPSRNNPFAALADLDEDNENVHAGPRARPARIRAAPATFHPEAYDAQRDFDRQQQPVVNASVLGHPLSAAEVESIPTVDDITEPASLSEALSGPYRAEWLSAAKKELGAHRANSTWRPAKLPRGRSPIPSKWIFKVKRKADGSVDKFKARLVAKGFRQRKGIDYNESFSPTLRPTTFRVLMAWANQMGLPAHQMDVVTAFLVSPLEEEIYLCLPEQTLVDINLPDFKHQAIVQLNKTLYGLVQSPAKFFQHFSRILRDIGFTQSQNDPCLWLKLEQGRTTAAIAIWVDDCVIVAPMDSIGSIKAALSRHLKMTDDGPLSWFLSIKACQDLDKGTLSLSQEPSISALAKKHGLLNARRIETPMDTRLQKAQTPITEEERTFLADKNYRSLVGSLMYFLFTRPDISYAVHQLTRQVADPRPDHWRAAQRVLRYLSCTRSRALTFRRSPAPFEFIGYSDADWAGDKGNRRSTSGVIFMLGGAAVMWKCKLQTCVALSTCEAELNALTEAVREAMWLKRLGHELFPQDELQPIVIHEDNKAALLVAENHRFSERTKHVAVKYFFIRDCVHDNIIVIIYCPTTDMIADIFTKPLGKIIFSRLCHRLGISSD
jgi:hypothetical protein